MPFGHVRFSCHSSGRLKKQIAELDAVAQPKGKNKTTAGHTAVKRSYGYDKTGNLIHSSDQRSGVTQFEYDKLGRITKADKETFAFDPAHNIFSDGQTVSDGFNAVTDNRIKHYKGISYYYDDLGNLIHRELADGEVQNYFYDLHDQLIKVEIFKKDSGKETWAYRYDALGRRIGKGRLKEDGEAETLSDGLKDNACLNIPNGKDILDSEIAFLWDGSHLLQEHNSDGLYTYIYIDQDSYEPLAQIRNRTNEEGESHQDIHYFHCDQIGIPREMTDKDGNLLWFGDYYGWGKLKSETNITGAHQPFRLQNQYCDSETGLHYNFFRYYEPECGRFVNQDPIGLWGGENLYIFAENIQIWIDPLGQSKKTPGGCNDKKDKCKGCTEPTLPDKEIARSGEVRVEHYYRSNDHAPAHMHVVGRGPKTRIGVSGKPLPGDPELSAAQKKFVAENISRIRRVGKKIIKWIKFKQECGET